MNLTVHTPAELAGLRIDFSRQKISTTDIEATIAKLLASGFETKRAALLAGDRVNPTEGRAAWHTVLRQPAAQQPETVARDISDAKHLALKIRTGEQTLPGGAVVQDVIVLGIGGSLLGPQLMVSALPKSSTARFHFIGNVDGHVLQHTFEACSPKQTLIVMISKTFTTLETQMNATLCLDWLAANGIEDVKNHVVAVTANKAAALKWGVNPRWTLGFEDWVGGRYSIWSAVAFPVMLACGVEAYDAACSGAHAVDTHFATEPMANNLPILMAAFELAAMARGEGARCVATYDERLAKLPDYLQQLEMESLGKRVQIDGKPAVGCGPLVWGTVGTTGQHSVFQWLHQGQQKTPIDFMVCAKPDHQYSNLHRSMLANCLAQAQALSEGRSQSQTFNELIAQGMAQDEATRLAPHMTFEGGRSSSLFILPKLNAFYLGAMLALYEHKVFVMSVFFNINAFDQYGVELGKIAAKRIDTALVDANQTQGLDDVTKAQLAWLQSN
jgi:glucose-6-phosphate isomerase